jgi:hypothetical protein
MLQSINISHLIFRIFHVGRQMVNHMKFKFLFLLLASLFVTQAGAKSISNSGGLGCGTIVSLRESTQKPLPSELADGYGAPRTSGGVVFQVLSYLPGVGVAAAVAGEVVASAGISAVSSKLQEADRAKQAETAQYKDVMAVEFRFDDGEVINIPVYVVSGMRYKVGARLNAMISPKYGNLALGANILFAGMPEVGDPDYNPACRIDDVEARASALEPLKSLVDEARIVNTKERRFAATPAPKTDEIAVSGSK